MDLFSDRDGLLIAGVDEAGRGPLAGNVVAAAVILGDDWPAGIDDSKKLTENKREHLAEQIMVTARAWSIGRATPEEIDELNILEASMLAMKRAVESLSMVPQCVLVDGNRLPRWSYRAEAVIGGDAIEPAISAASILAKVTRDRELYALDAAYPEYGFARHKGYPTPEHLRALKQFGVTPLHRRSFGPVKRLLEVV